MRYIPIRELSAGMCLGEDLYNDWGRLLVSKRTRLTRDLIADIKGYSFPGVYIIEDNDTEEDMVKRVISSEIRQETLRMIHELFLLDEEENGDQEELIRLADRIVNDVIGRKDVVCNMIDIKDYDSYTYYHSLNVCALSVLLGISYGMSDNMLKELAVAALLHDIGKRYLVVDILHAKRKLTDEEWERMKMHPQDGYDFLRRKFQFSDDIYMGVLQHHENFDGSGYPQGKKGYGISLFARVIRIADVYDALTSKRPYHEAWKLSEAIEYIMAMGGKEFDPKLVDAFLEHVAVYPKGKEVKLSNGRPAVIVTNIGKLVLRPVIKLLDTDEIIDLTQNRNWLNVTIVEA